MIAKYLKSDYYSYMKESSEVPPESYETPLPQTPEELEAELSDHARRIAEITPVIASIALHTTVQREQLITAADSLVSAAQETRQNVNIMALVERFGDESSYWTVFRMFAVEQNIGRPRSIAEVFDYLSRNYDMSEETLGTLEKTLQEWTEDLESDARARGINGTFTKVDGGYVFAEFAKQPSSVIKKPRSKKVPEPRPEHVLTEEQTAEVLDPLAELEATIRQILQQSADHAAKQADVKKQIARAGGPLLLEHLQRDVDAVVERGGVHKFRRNRVAYLSLDPREDEHTLREVDVAEAEDKTFTFDVSLAMTILESLTAYGTHYNQKLTMNDLWRRINDDESLAQRVPEEESEKLKRACRQLQSLGLLSAGIKTTAEVKSKRTRGSSRREFRVRLESQEQKKQIQQLLQSPNAVDLLGRMYVNRSTTSSQA